MSTREQFSQSPMWWQAWGTTSVSLVFEHVAVAHTRDTESCLCVVCCPCSLHGTHCNCLSSLDPDSVWSCKHHESLVTTGTQTTCVFSQLSAALADRQVGLDESSEGLWHVTQLLWRILAHQNLMETLLNNQPFAVCLLGLIDKCIFDGMHTLYTLSYQVTPTVICNWSLVVTCQWTSDKPLSCWKVFASGCVTDILPLRVKSLWSVSVLVNHWIFQCWPLAMTTAVRSAFFADILHKYRVECSLFLACPLVSREQQ